MNELDSFVEGHLNLQVKISYSGHHDFLVRHGLNDCSAVLDVGTGNGSFAARLAENHPNIRFVGIDKRKPCIQSCKKIASGNFEAVHVDMFSRVSSFDFSTFDGFLMRYFLLHVDHSYKILELLKLKTKRPTRFWIIDLDWSQFTCEPKHESFEKLTKLVKDFCSKTSSDSMGGQNVLPLLKKLGYQNISHELGPFTTARIPLEDLTLYLKQEVQCYARMIGQGTHDPDTTEILRFIDDEVRSGKFQVSYGMVLITAELT